ncbi:LuxR family transcriptional regulator [Streptomyces sp. NPDC051207]|uniref:LuxR family transcriptional regulator n=1 Tax=Streptomyces sp. NPDC051207 TaxID=3154641 RepID=UPI00342E1E85
MGDELEQTLLQMRALVEDAVSKTRQRAGAAQSAVTVVTDPSDERIRRTAERLISTARRSVTLALPSCQATMSGALSGLLDRLREISAVGVAVRVLGGPEILDDRNVRRHLVPLPPRACFDVRIAEHQHQAVLIVDERMALLRAEFGRAGAQTVTFRVPIVLRALDALFTGAWSTATPAQSYRRVSARGRSEIARQVLVCLTSGNTDEASAQSLGLSVRTYRRHVAELMQELGAVSRFQAGVHAVELGLLAPGALAA